MHAPSYTVFSSLTYRQATISSTTVITKMVVRTLEIIAIGWVLVEFADVDVALQDAFTDVVSTEMVVTVVGTNFVTFPFVF